jgi:hypothetical protein
MANTPKYCNGKTFCDCLSKYNPYYCKWNCLDAAPNDYCDVPYGTKNWSSCIKKYGDAWCQENCKKKIVMIDTIW